MFGSNLWRLVSQILVVSDFAGVLHESKILFLILQVVSAIHVGIPSAYDGQIVRYPKFIPVSQAVSIIQPTNGNPQARAVDFSNIDARSATVETLAETATSDSVRLMFQIMTLLVLKLKMTGY